MVCPVIDQGDLKSPPAPLDPADLGLADHGRCAGREHPVVREVFALACGGPPAVGQRRSRTTGIWAGRRSRLVVEEPVVRPAEGVALWKSGLLRPSRLVGCRPCRYGIG